MICCWKGIFGKNWAGLQTIGGAISNITYPTFYILFTLNLLSAEIHMISALTHVIVMVSFLRLKQFESTLFSRFSEGSFAESPKR